jgi:hypothetical protein
MQVHEVPRRPRTPSAPTAVLGAVVLGLCIPLFRGDLAAEAGGRPPSAEPEPAQSEYVQGTPAQARQFPPVFLVEARPPVADHPGELALATRGDRSSMADLLPHRGVLILVFGILGFVLCFPFGIVAWVMGSTDLKAMDAGRMDPEGRALTRAGQVLGIIMCALIALMMIIGVIAALVAMFASAGH